ncbi:NAD(P)/FAD-dependent oxidoreductase [Rhodococcus sp. HNM0569]|uniref:dihydrolipoyl dehydrogenase family protein n=1 Tax=Rhodococcus sp. HNM0569 TaxID=2716340 RepID=UPI00146DB9E6|nr:NAD(P)/FAD-dependent oxidoreductase [Rhodococcus sp. HNM0569]NLU82553.1 NAD(P)/FAD-dependent oxidoreductase [Rhodococcus sp. HNM0569]
MAANESTSGTDASSAADEYDVVVIGGGPAGEVAADAAIAGSDRTAIVVERELVGGECSYWACMPSKALLVPGEILRGAQHMGGVSANGLDVDAVFTRRNSFTHDYDDSAQLDWAEQAGIAIARGDARLSGEREVTVASSPPHGERTLRARQAVIVATGSAASIPGTPGLAEALPWTSRDATALREIPRRIAIVGGGVVACEAATWLRDLGSEEVTLVVRGRSLLSRAEPFARDLVADALRERGVDVLFETDVRSVHRPDARDTGHGRIHGGPATLDLAGGEPLVVDEILVAAGRTPHTAGLGLDGSLLDDHGYVRTDEHTTAAGEWLYAVGDANGRAPLTHMGKYQARVCGDVIAARAEGRPLDGPAFRLRENVTTQVVFTSPQVAWVGLTEREARDAGLDVVAVDSDIAVAGAALARDDFSGRARLVLDRGTRAVVGATFAGTEVAELLHAATVAVVGTVPVDDLWHAVPAYPTVSEVWLGLLSSARDQLRQGG